MRERASIPERMTVAKLPSGPAEERNIIRGHRLTREMTAFLEAALRGWEEEERLLQLEQLDARLARVFRLFQAGADSTAIAHSLRVSQRTAQRLIRAALRYMYGDRYQEEPSAGEERLLALAALDRRALLVYEMACHGWTQEQVAAATGISERTVRRLYATARAIAGDVDRRTVRRFGGVRVAGGAGRSVADSEALDRDNAALHAGFQTGRFPGREVEMPAAEDVCRDVAA